jgi:diketogulonate reductase-like aldo/keto reductase
MGTYLLDRDAVTVGGALRSAIVDSGYRRIDCAPVYFNEDAVGDALRDILQQEQQQQHQSDDTPGRPTSSSIQRSDLFIVSKLASPFHRNVEEAVRKTLNDLRLEYLDLYLGRCAHVCVRAQLL